MYCGVVPQMLTWFITEIKLARYGCYHGELLGCFRRSRKGSAPGVKMRQKVGNENSAWKCQTLENRTTGLSWVRCRWCGDNTPWVLVYRLDRAGSPVTRGTQKPIQSRCATCGSQAACQVCCCPLTHLCEEVKAGPEVPNALLRGWRESSCPHLFAFIFRTNLP